MYVNMGDFLNTVFFVEIKLPNANGLFNNIKNNLCIKLFLDFKMGSYHVDEKFYSRHTKLWPSEADL